MYCTTLQSFWIRIWTFLVCYYAVLIHSCLTFIYTGWEDGKFKLGSSTNRNAILPSFLVYRNHPLQRNRDGIALVYESTPEELLSKYSKLSEHRIPMSVNHQELYEDGFLHLQPNMAIFYRNLHLSQDPKDDLLKVWVTDERSLRSSHGHDIERLDQLRDELLGPDESLEGGRKGGTALERSGRGDGNLQGSRCNTYGNSKESVRNIAHPSGNMSCSSAAPGAAPGANEDKSMLKTLSSVLKVCCIVYSFTYLSTNTLLQHSVCLAVCALMSAPDEWIELQKSRWEVNNLPAMGDDCNTGFFSQLQINLAGAEEHESVHGLEKNLGRAGCPHTDCHDCPQSFTSMFAMGNLDKYDIHPGMFFFLELGVYVELQNYRLVQFSGLHLHGGSPPRAAPGKEVPKEATRLVNINYPNDGILSGSEVPSVLGLTGARSRLEFVPSVRYNTEYSASLSTGPLNYVRDGLSMMSDTSYQIYVPRQLAAILETVVSQSELLDLNVDALKILFKNKSDGTVVDYFKDWKYPPGMSQDTRVSMSQVAQQVNDHKIKAAMSVPQQLHRLYKNGQIQLQADGDSPPRLVMAQKNSQSGKRSKKGK